MQTDSDAVGRHESRERLLNDFPGAAGKPCWTAPRLAEKDDSLVTIYAKPANPKFFPLIAKFFLRIDGGGLEGTKLCS